MNYTQEQVNQIVAEAKGEAYKAAQKFFQEKLGGVDQFAPGPQRAPLSGQDEWCRPYRKSRNFLEIV